VGSRHAAIRSVIAISSALASRFAKSLRKGGNVAAAMCGRASAFKISCSVTADLSKPPDQFSERRETVGVKLENGAYWDVGVENDPHPSGGSTSF